MPNNRFSLFPDSPSMRQVFSLRSLRYRWRNGEPVVTSAIIVVCVTLWIVEFVLNLVSRPALADLLQYGAMQPYRAAREPWMFVTSMFLHSPTSIFHILFNMLTLWCVGPFLERLMGHWPYLMLYMIAGIGGGVGMELWAAFGRDPSGWITYSYGASGALFGLFAACLVVYRKAGADMRSMLVWMAINFAMPLVVPNIAWQAHVGGFIFGGLLTLLVVDGPRALRGKSTLARTSIYGGALLLLEVIIVVICNQNNIYAMML